MHPKHGQFTTPKRASSFLKKLRGHPALLERFEAILDLAESEDGAGKTADGVEELLVEEIRKLGNQTMQDWAVRAEERAAETLRRSPSKVWLCKKKACFGGPALARSAWRNESGNQARRGICGP